MDGGVRFGRRDVVVSSSIMLNHFTNLTILYVPVIMI